MPYLSKRHILGGSRHITPSMPSTPIGSPNSSTHNLALLVCEDNPIAEAMLLKQVEKNINGRADIQGRVSKAPPVKDGKEKSGPENVLVQVVDGFKQARNAIIRRAMEGKRFDGMLTDNQMLDPTHKNLENGAGLKLGGWIDKRWRIKPSASGMYSADDVKEEAESIFSRFWPKKDASQAVSGILGFARNARKIGNRIEVGTLPRSRSVTTLGLSDSMMSEFPSVVQTPASSHSNNPFFPEDVSRTPRPTQTTPRDD